MGKILITGSNGFVGRALCAEMKRRGLEFVAAIRKPDTSVNSSIEQRCVGTIDEKTDWQLALQNCDSVIHLAGRAHILSENAENPLHEFRKVNVEGTLQLARYAISIGVRRFVFVSSVGVFGQTTGKPFTPSDIPKPIDDYAVSKLEAEVALKNLCAGSGMELVIVRPPLVYGPGCPGNFHRLLKLIDLGLPLPFGRVSGERSFVSVWNLVDFLITCLFHPFASNNTFVVSDGQNLTLPQLLRLVGEGMGKPVVLLPINERLLAIGARLARQNRLYEKLCGELRVNSEDAFQILGWQPPMTLSEGLRRTGRAFSKNQDLPNPQ